MNYRVHQIFVKKESAQEKLERFLNQLNGEVISIAPFISSTLQGMGATSKVDYFLVVEKSE